MLAAALVACVGGCAGGEPGSTPTGDRVFVADPPMIRVNPGDTGTAKFVLTSGGVPIALQAVTFEIPDDDELPGVEAKGAVLAATTAVTDGAGVATVDVTAGEETTFFVVASAGGATVELVVIVTPEAGTVMVAPFFTPNSTAASRTTSIEVLLVDNGRCADLDPVRARSLRGAEALPSSGGTARFDIVSTSGSSALVGRALGGRGALAVGCIDLLGSSLVPNGVVQVALPLRDTSLTPVGTYTLSSPLLFVPPLAAAAKIAVPWRDLGDCPLDPVQLFLDCTIDALSPETVADPLDCKPSTVAGGEGALGDALAARRGTPIAVSSCRSAQDGAGAPSLDAIAMGLFDSPTPALVVALPAIGTDAARVLDRVDLTSSLDVRPSGHADEYVVTHGLTAAQMGFTTVNSATVNLATLALPALTAYTTAVMRNGLLIIDDHGFSLRLGRVARAGFGLSALAPRLPGDRTPDAGGLIGELLFLLRARDDDSWGCAALDRVLCAEVGRPPECLAAACPAGLSALVAKLNAAFDAADGTGLDFYLAGSASLIDMRGDGVAHQLGASPTDTDAMASWSVDLTTASGPARMTASFTGTRN